MRLAVGTRMMSQRAKTNRQLAVRRHGRPRQRGMMLFEVLIVIAIIAMIATGVAIAALSHYEKARIKNSLTNARAIRGGVKLWWLEHSAAECPDLKRLVQDGVLERGTPLEDSWSSAWRITCEGQEVLVASNGPDRAPHTPDDIRDPRD